jgi:REP element-mobilizing transposase RayT
VRYLWAAVFLTNENEGWRTLLVCVPRHCKTGWRTLSVCVRTILYETVMDMPSKETILIRRKRRLPHWQEGGRTYFITFDSLLGKLPADALKEVIRATTHDHGRRYFLHIPLAMPDHCHMLITPLRAEQGKYHDLRDILRGVKGASARNINKMLNRSGRVWQAESYDRIMRNVDEFRERWKYIWANPVNAGLSETLETYPYVAYNIDEGLWE